MTNEMIKKLCGDMLIYIDKSAESLPSSADLSVTAIRDTIITIYENPAKTLEWSESLFKMIDGLYEMAKCYIYYDESGLFTARGFASRLYDELREMRP